MAETCLDGSVIYRYPDELTDILFNGLSAKGLQLKEVKVYSNGMGYIMCLRKLDAPDVEPKRMIDTQYLTHTYYGQITIIE